MKIISWNVNGLNSAIKNGFSEYLEKENADIYCFQETKVSEKTLDKAFKFPENYKLYWNKAERNGYSGVICLSKEEPLSVQYGMGVDEYDTEGRLITLEFPIFYLLNAYIPNAGRGLPKLDYKLEYNKKFLEFCETLKKDKHVILCGDLNVAHKEIDLKNPKSNKTTAGFTQEERDSFTEFLNTGYVDTFREFEKGCDHYTWWSYRNDARERNIGWRLDYFVVNSDFMKNVKKSDIIPEIQGSDHCPIRLVIE